MTDVSVEFHACEEELLSFVEEVAAELGLFISAIQFPPFKIAAIEISDLQKTASNKKTDRFALTTSPLSLPPEPFLKPLETSFWEHNPNALIIHLGRLTERGLKESWLTARTFDPATLDVWRRVARELRSRTRAGAVAINPETGASGRLRAHRFTEGAMRLQEQGVAMLPLAGGSVIRLGG